MKHITNATIVYVDARHRAWEPFFFPLVFFLSFLGALIKKGREFLAIHILYYHWCGIVAESWLDTSENATRAEPSLVSSVYI